MSQNLGKERTGNAIAGVFGIKYNPKPSLTRDTPRMFALRDNRYSMVKQNLSFNEVKSLLECDGQKFDSLFEIDELLRFTEQVTLTNGNVIEQIDRRKKIEYEKN